MQRAYSEKIDAVFQQLLDESAECQSARLHELAALREITEAEQQLIREMLRADAKSNESHWLEESPLAISSRLELDATQLHIDAHETDSYPQQKKEQSENTLPREYGKYLVDETALGKGGFGKVYRAYDTVQDTYVALKVPRYLLSTKSEKAKFLREAIAISHLQNSEPHPNIVTVYNADIGMDDQPYIAMEYIEGINLYEHLKLNGKCSLTDAGRILIPIADAMALAHRHNIVHRDLKPANILLTAKGIPKVTDFGLAIRDDQSNPRELAGSLGYMAPEQLLGNTHDLQDDTDVWALGVILYEMLTGKRPFANQNQILERRYKRLRSLENELPSELERLCDECLRKNADERPTASDVAKRLEQLVESQSQQLGIQGDSNAVSTNSPRRTIVGLVVIAAVLLCICLSVIILFQGWSGQSPQLQTASKRSFPTSGKRYALFDRRQERLVLSPGDHPPSVDADLQLVRTTNSGYSLFSSGNAKHGTYTIGIDLKKPSYEGWSGLFFNAQEIARDEPVQNPRQTVARLACFCVSVDCVIDPFSSSPLSSLVIKRLEFELDEAGKKWNLISARTIAGDKVAFKSRLKYGLEVRVENNRLADVRFKGEPQSELVGEFTRYMSEKGISSKMHGAFGTANFGGSCEFSNGNFIWEQ